VAVGRYIVICRPLHARYLVSVTATQVAIVAAFILAVLIELPLLHNECQNAVILLDYVRRNNRFSLIWNQQLVVRQYAKLLRRSDHNVKSKA